MTAPTELANPIRVGPTLRELAISYACRAYDLTPAEMKGPRKYQHLTCARALFVWLVRRYRPAVSYSTIGRWIGRDHSSAIHLHKRAEALLASDDEFAQECARFPMFLARQEVLQ